MTAKVLPSADAPPTLLNWDTINWKKVVADVRQLQLRIAKAFQQGKHRKAKALQWILSHSFYAKLLAVKRVVSNKGAKTPGVDGITWDTPSQKMNAAISLKRRGYKTKPLKRIYIPKKQKGKLRPLSIPVMGCRAQQALHLLTLEPIAEIISDKNAYGFRPFRSTADAIERCFVALSRKHSAQFVLEGDIRACFDTISHPWLQSKVNVCVYADDFIITGTTREVLMNKVKPVVEAFLSERGLSLSQEKTKITHIDEGFDFLGMNIRKYKGKLIIKPAKSNVKRFLADIRETIKCNKTIKTENLIKLLNLKIRGWSNYYRHVCSRYFHQDKLRNWSFTAKTKDKYGNLVDEKLVPASKIPIKRHIKIKADATPYDMAYHDYFDKLIAKRKIVTGSATGSSWWMCWWKLFKPQKKKEKIGSPTAAL